GIVAGTLVAGLAGLGLGYLTLRLRGVFFAIASLALAVVLYIFVVNWDYVGGARGAYVIQPREIPFGLPRYIHLIYAVQLVRSAFSLSYAVNSIAMPLIGGMMSWMGPLIGAVLLGSVQQLVQVTVSSAWNLLIVGVLLVLFVTLAPNGIMGWVDAWRRRKGR